MMNILLKKEVAKLGQAGELVKVKDGYAMNYLIPQGYAVLATKSVIKQYEETQRQRANKEAKLLAEAQELAAKVSSMLFKIALKVSDSGKTYGSATPAQLADALAAAGIQADKKDITILADDVRSLGIYDAELTLDRGVKAAFQFEVVAG